MEGRVDGGRKDGWTDKHVRRIEGWMEMRVERWGIEGWKGGGIDGRWSGYRTLKRTPEGDLAELGCQAEVQAHRPSRSPL